MASGCITLLSRATKLDGARIKRGRVEAKLDLL